MYTPEFKADAVLQVLQGGTSDEVGAKLGVPAAELTGWVDHFLANIEHIFERKTASNKPDALVKKLTKQVEHHTIELNWLKSKMPGVGNDRSR
jgi:transposase-like protein